MNFADELRKIPTPEERKAKERPIDWNQLVSLFVQAAKQECKKNAESGKRSASFSLDSFYEKNAENAIIKKNEPRIRHSTTPDGYRSAHNYDYDEEIPQKTCMTEEDKEDFVFKAKGQLEQAGLEVDISESKITYYIWGERSRTQSQTERRLGGLVNALFNTSVNTDEVITRTVPVKGGYYYSLTFTMKW